MNGIQRGQGPCRQRSSSGTSYSVSPMLWSAAVTDEMSNEVIEAARALRATADATKEAIGAIEKTGGFLNRVFGNIVEDSIGVVADRIKFYRIQNYLALSENTARIMRDRGYSDADITRVVTPKVAIPLIESATLKDDKELQALWAQLLANAMDSKFNLDVGFDMFLYCARWNRWMQGF